MRYQSLHDIRQPLVRTLRVDDDCILCDVIDIEVLHWRNFDLGWIHGCGLLEGSLEDREKRTFQSGLRPGGLALYFFVTDYLVIVEDREGLNR